MFWSTRVSLVTGVKKWTDSQLKKKSGLNAVRRTPFPWLPKTHWSPRSGCVLMNIKLSTDRLARVAVFMLLCPIQSNLNDKNTNVWNQRALAIMAHITRSLRQQLHAHTQTRTHSLRVQCCCCTIKRGRYRDDGPSIRGELGRTGKNRETMATGFWGWVKQAVDKGGFRQREDQTSADRLSRVLIGEPGARACVWQHRSCHQSRYFGKNPKSSSFSSQLQADVRIIYQFLSVWLNFYVLLRNKSCNVSCTLTAGHRVGGLINQWNPVQCSYFMLQVIRQSFLWFVLRSHFFNSWIKVFSCHKSNFSKIVLTNLSFVSVDFFFSKSFDFTSLLVFLCLHFIMIHYSNIFFIFFTFF